MKTEQEIFDAMNMIFDWSDPPESPGTIGIPHVAVSVMSWVLGRLPHDVQPPPQFSSVMTTPIELLLDRIKRDMSAELN